MHSAGLILEGERQNVATATALPFVAGLYFGFRSFIMVLSVHLLGTDPRTGTAIDLACDYFLLILVGFGTLAEARVPIRKMWRVAEVRWAFIFLIFTGLSLLWSDSASLSTSVAYWCAMVSDVAIVILLVRAGPLKSACCGLMDGYVWGACVVAVIAWIMPAQSDLRLGDEELLGANQIGYLCGFAFFFAQYLMREQKRRLVAPATLLVVTMLRCLSKTTLIAFLISEGFLLVMDKSMRRRTKVFLLASAFALTFVFWGLFEAYYDVYTTASSQAETLTGRLGIWAYMLAEAVQQPWLGHGFDSVWNVVPPFGAEKFEAAHAHNELIQQFYAYGLAGICMFAGIYLSLFRHIRRLAKGPSRTCFFAFLLFVLVRGLADTERFDLSLPMWALIMIGLLIEDARNAPGNQSELATQSQLPLEAT